MVQSRDSLEPISIQESAKKVSSAVLPFLATLLTTGLVARAAGTGVQGFLTEPTLEFKDEEKKVAEFKAQQQKIRKSWDEIIVKLEASDSPLVTEACIKDLTAVLVKYNSGIPSGVKKLELVKTIRAKKYVMVGKKQKILPTWSKESEIQYQVIFFPSIDFVKIIISNLRHILLEKQCQTINNVYLTNKNADTYPGVQSSSYSKQQGWYF